ncbi:adhesion G protein-coupled receptor E2-like isoform 8-T8 [Salvelinus alpinus]
MTGRLHLLILALHLAPLMEHVSGCPPGFSKIEKDCIDEDECNPPSDYYDDDPVTPQICGENAACINTEGSFYCQCALGFRSSSQRMNFTAASPEKCIALHLAPLMEHVSGCPPGFSKIEKDCIDEDECNPPSDYYDDDPVTPQICGENAACINTEGSFYCQCALGFRSSSQRMNFTAASPEKCIALHLAPLMEHVSGCPPGFSKIEKDCIDEDECNPPSDYYDDDPVTPQICGENAACINTEGSFYCQCALGFRSSSQRMNFTAASPEKCIDINECLENKDTCCPNAECHNVLGSYSCICNEGFVSSTGAESFTFGQRATCEDRNECVDDSTICGKHTQCVNTPGSYSCVCNPGFGLKSGKAQFTENGESCEEITDQKATTDQTATTDSEDAQGAKDLCKINRFICGGNGTCHNAANGGHRCACHAGFTNYGDPQGRCTELNCDTFASEKHLKMVIPGLQDAVALMRTSCLELSESNTAEQVDGEALLETLLSAIDRLLSRGPLNNNKEVSVLLDLVETALRIIGPLLKHPETRRFKTHTEVELLVQRNASSPQGPLTLSSTHAQLDSHWETAAGDTSYPGFATVSLLSYKGLETSTNNSFSGLKAQEGHSFQINSKVVTATISNKDTSFLKEPVTFTFSHLKESDEGSYTCVYWDAELGEGTWSDRGCFLLQSNATHTVCSCYHLSSFAVLMALYEFKTSKSTQKTGESQI